MALVAEIIAGELTRRLGLRTPNLVLAELEPRIPLSEPDPEIQDLAHRPRRGAVLPSQLATADPRHPFDAREHVLGDRATELAEAHSVLALRITEPMLREVAGLVPPEGFGDRGAEAYVEHLLLCAPVVPEVIRR